MASTNEENPGNPSDLLIRRNSIALLSEPAPAGEVLDRILQAGLSAPDHALLRPWRFLVIEGAAREKLGKVFAEAALRDQPDLSEEAVNKYLAMPLRAPMLIVGIVCMSEHPKVPQSEQLLSAGAAMSYILAAAQAENFGAMWRTGPMAYHSWVQSELGLTDREQITGFLYVGTPSGSIKNRPLLPVPEYFSRWE